MKTESTGSKAVLCSTVIPITEHHSKLTKYLRVSLTDDKKPLRFEESETTQRMDALCSTVIYHCVLQETFLKYVWRCA